MQIDATVPAHVPVAERAPDRDFSAGLEAVRAAPRDEGTLHGIVIRPRVDVRETLDEVDLDPDTGVAGDNWLDRGSGAASASARAYCQVTLINTRVLAAVEPDPGRWPLAGDQLLVDLDLSVGNLPPGSLLEVGGAIVEVSEQPHTGCAKFSARYGSDALRWINSPEGRAHRMRGVNARIVQAGTVRVGDEVRVLRD